MSLRGLAASSAFHAVILLLLVFGLPSFLDPEPLPQPMVMSVELLPVSEISNVANSTPKPPKKVDEPPKPLEAKEAIKEKKIEPEKPKETEKPKEKVKEPEKVKPTEITPEKPKEKEKPIEPEKPKEKEKSFEETMAELNKAKPKEPPAPKVNTETGTPKEGPKAISESAFDQNSPAAMALQDNIRSQIMPCWLYTGGAPEDKVKPAKILVSVNPDGSIASAKLHGSQAGEYQSNGYFRAIVDSAIRATRNGSCTPLKNLPADQHHMWKELVVTFDPRVML